MEHCNLVAESLESGVAAPVASDYARLKLEAERLAADRGDKAAELARVKAQLDRGNGANQSLAGRLDAIEQRAAGHDAVPKPLRQRRSSNGSTVPRRNFTWHLSVSTRRRHRQLYRMDAYRFSPSWCKCGWRFHLDKESSALE